MYKILSNVQVVLYHYMVLFSIMYPEVQIPMYHSQQWYKSHVPLPAGVHGFCTWEGMGHCDVINRTKHVPIVHLYTVSTNQMPKICSVYLLCVICALIFLNLICLTRMFLLLDAFLAVITSMFVHRVFLESLSLMGAGVLIINGSCCRSHLNCGLAFSALSAWYFCTVPSTSNTLRYDWLRTGHITSVLSLGQCPTTNVWP